MEQTTKNGNALARRYMREYLKMNRNKLPLNRIGEFVEELQREAMAGRLAGADRMHRKQLSYIVKHLAGNCNANLHRQAGELVPVHIPPAKVGFLKKLLNASEKAESLSGFIIPPPKVKGVVEPLTFRADDIPENNQKTYQFDEQWAGLWNRPFEGFSSMVYGQPKSGKSTLAMDFAGYLAREGMGPVLYASIEEGLRGTITERIDRLAANHPRLILKNYLPANLTPYKFIVVDSVSRGFMDIDTMRQMIADWPGKSFLFIFHVTKDGLPRGKNDYQHEVDVLVEVKEGKATAVGRFGPGEMDVCFSRKPENNQNQ